MNNLKERDVCAFVACAACLASHLDSLINSISKHLFLTAVTAIYPLD